MASEDLYGEFLQVNQVESQGKLHAKIGEPRGRSCDPGGNCSDYCKQDGESGDGIKIGKHEDLCAHAEDEAANDRSSQSKKLLLP